MNTKRHPLVGLFVSGYLFGQNSIARVEAVKMTGRGKNRIMTGLVVRPHCASAAARVPADVSSWERGVQSYVGNRRHIPLEVVKKVWPGAEEAWVEYDDFIEWCNGDTP